MSARQIIIDRLKGVIADVQEAERFADVLLADLQAEFGKSKILDVFGIGVVLAQERISGRGHVFVFSPGVRTKAQFGESRKRNLSNPKPVRKKPQK